MMTQLVADGVLSQRLRGATAPIEVVDEAGQFLGIFDPLQVAAPGVAAARTPNSIEKLQELRKQVGGRSLADIMRDLEKRA